MFISKSAILILDVFLLFHCFTRLIIQFVSLHTLNILLKNLYVCVCICKDLLMLSDKDLPVLESSVITKCQREMKMVLWAFFIYYYTRQKNMYSSSNKSGKRRLFFCVSRFSFFFFVTFMMKFSHVVLARTRTQRRPSLVVPFVHKQTNKKTVLRKKSCFSSCHF